ncbi:MAG: helix-turn-helix transcriptional regulator [Gemmatimonadales bacterium]|nr:MAG: helix-turn-helix transcriptional regulator [Gemmatimonadales bacterium]
MHSSADGVSTETTGASARPSLPLCGRAEELSLLRIALDRAAAGESKTLVLAGPEGMGKTRLARTAADAAERRGFTAAMGSAYPLESGVPYALFCDVLDPLVRNQAPEALISLTRGAPELQFVCPSLALHDAGGTGHTPEAIPDLRSRLLWNFPEFLDRLRRGDPLLLVFEDLEWADPSSLELLHVLARRALGFPCVLLVTLDPDGSPEGPGIMEAVRGFAGSSGAELRTLGPLAPEDTVELVSGGFEVDPEVVRGFAIELCRWTGGNPLFVGATLDRLVETGQIHREGGSWVGWEPGDLTPPTSVESLVMERAAALSPPTGSVAGVAAVIGPKVRFEVLAGASTLGESALHLATGEHREAMVLGDEGMEPVDRSGYRAWGVHRRLPTLAEAALHLRDLDRARELAARLRSDAERLDHPAARAWASICEALVVWLEGDSSRGAREMAEGAEALESMGLLPDAARLRRQVAGRLAEIGDREGAVRELRRAHEALLRIGAEPELEKAREQFREVGARPPLRSQGERGSSLLTSREIEIARLVGRRKSNKGVAKALGISPRTVGTHLTNIFRKLEIDSRWELGDRVREGLLDTGTADGFD